MEGRGSPAPGPSGGEGGRDELGVRGMCFPSPSEVRRQLGQIMSWGMPVAEMEDVNAVL